MKLKEEEADQENNKFNYFLFIKFLKCKKKFFSIRFKKYYF